MLVPVVLGTPFFRFEHSSRVVYPTVDRQSKLFTTVELALTRRIDTVDIQGTKILVLGGYGLVGMP